MNIKNISTLTIAFAIIAIFVGLSGCERISKMVGPPTSEMDDSSEEITIGLVLPQTGRLASVFGKYVEQAFELALNEINDLQLAGSNLKFITIDDQGTPEGAIEAYKKLIEENNVSIILGPATSSATKQTFPIAKEHQIVAISSTSAARGLSAISDFTFRVALTTDVLVPHGVEVTHAKLAYQTVATLYDETDDFSIDGDKAVKEELIAKGVKILDTVTFQGGETNDFTEQLTHINALNPDAIFVSSLPGEKAEILRKGHELGITAPFIIRTLTEADVEAAGEAAEGAITFVGWGTAVDTPGNQTFIEKYTATYGIGPNNYAARSYATLHILAEAIANAKSHDAADIRDALANISDFDTVLGKFSFDENGDAVYEPKILIVKDGKLELF
ncbi:ABC transporter substrate-binding protein [Candidatus Poribacteria bacterium]|nr:ABC transporter substrate-binding protein [Candidatus Poribacteria bacterium]